MDTIVKKTQAARPIRKGRITVVDADLFDGASVTAADVRVWLRDVARMDPDSPRSDWYIRAYHVADKIRAAKLRGDWPPIPDALA